MSDFFQFEHHSLTVVTTREPARFDLETAAQVAGVHADLLRQYCRMGLLGPARLNPEECDFDDDAIYELQRIDHYRTQHGVNLHALPVVLELLREVERLRGELRRARKAQS